MSDGLRWQRNGLATAIRIVMVQSLGVLVAVLSVGVVFSSEIPPTWQDDAALHDVQFVGSKCGFAVGSHGTILRTLDGGRSWTLCPSGVECSLNSVCFLTDQIGWVAGGTVVPFASVDQGTLLFTENGGQTWKSIAKDQLPRIITIKFFGLEEGVALTSSSTDAPSGLFKTADGGNTWRRVEGEAIAPWRTGCFLDPDLGVVAGHGGHLSLMAGERVVDSKLIPQGLRSIRAITVQHNDSGWLAGDGGMVLRTSSGGVAWESPPTSLPEELRQLVDFRGVEMRGEKVWLVGAPGSVIWHSPDGGHRWERQSTGQSLPLNAIRFTNDAQGIAVGEMGLLLRTENGGKTWTAVRGANRRTAILSMEARPSQVSSAWIARLSGEHGYRSRIWIANRQDIGETARSGDDESRLTSASEITGGNGAEIHWQLPVAISGLEYSPEKLQADWQKRTEGKLGPALLGTLVRQIRMWRPSVVIIDEAAKDDAAGTLLNDAVIRSIEQAADSTRFVEQSEILGLSAWKVDRIYMRLAASMSGDVLVDFDEYLPTRKTTVRLAASLGDAMLRTRGQIRSNVATQAQRLTFRMLDSNVRSVRDVVSSRNAGADGAIIPRDFFAGMSLSPGADARRALSPLDESDLEHRQKQVQRQRNLTAFVQKTFNDQRLANQMIGQLGTILSDLTAREGAEFLRAMAVEYHDRSQFELVEATNVELIRRYPTEPAAIDAMRWLIQFWTSSEAAWQRIRSQSSETRVARGDAESQRSQIEQVAATLATGRGGVTTADGNGNPQVPYGLPQSGDESSKRQTPATSPFQMNDSSGRVKRMDIDLDFDKSGNAKGKVKGSRNQSGATRMSMAQTIEWRTDAVRDWHARAAELARQLETTAPSIARTTDIQFPLAALRRGSRATSQSDSIYRNFLTHGTDAATRSLAQRELWAMFSTAEAPQEVVLCRKAIEKPMLDGLLSDSCWQTSHDLRLTKEPINLEEGAAVEATSSLVMLTYDAEFLYIGFSAPKFDGLKYDRSMTSGRTYDSEVSRHDRLSICLDVDRDYTTWYELIVDQRGCTLDRCWEDQRWNPGWFVASSMDDTSWRVEAAIPWADLVPAPPQRGAIWSASISRTIPAEGMQSWVHPARSRPRPTSFGLMKFE